MHQKELEDNILDQIIYRGEGNSSIVIAFKSRAKVIRLRKDGKIIKSKSQDHHVTQHPMRSLQFIHLIMKPLTDPFLGGTIELIHLKSGFINSLSDKVEAYRPIHRLEKTLLLVDQYALVMDDLCTLPNELTNNLEPEDFFGPAMSIEIKPKQGFLPIHRLPMKSSSLNDQYLARMRNCCLYGSTQYIKLARGQINETSDYCPINLFSGCPIRMKAALESLINNPQNNLRIFKDRTLAYDENNEFKLSSVIDDFFGYEQEASPKPHHKSCYSNEERLIELIIQSLLDHHDGREAGLSYNHVGDFENFCNNSDFCLQHPIKVRCKRCDIHPSMKKLRSDPTNSIHRLPRTCVLSTVLRAQKLDTIGAHGALHMLEWLIEDARLNNGMDVLEELSKPQMPKGFGSLHPLPCETKREYYFRKVWEFLVSLTAKDCSIIVTLRRISDGRYDSIISKQPNARNHLLKECKYGNYYMYNVGIADLDQKMPRKILRICDNLDSILQIPSDSGKTELLNLQVQSGNKLTKNK